MQQSLTIIGSGMAAYTLAREWRKRDTTSPLTIITADDGASYSKSMLSAAFAQQKTPAMLAQASAEQMAAQLQANILPHTQVTQIDVAQHTLQANGQSLSWQRLVLATGADTLNPQLTGDAANHVLSVNSLQDYARFRGALENVRHVTLLGGGLIGCEFANDLATAGYPVTVVHAGNWPLDRSIPEVAGKQMVHALNRLGVDYRLQRRAKSVHQHINQLSVTLDNGEAITTDLIVSAIGLKPRTALAVSADIAINRGILVDEHLRTNIPDIYALGDGAELNGQLLPFVQPLLTQARALAATLAGDPTPVRYPVMPVIVKTPAYPIALVTPPVKSEWQWHIDTQPNAIYAAQRDADDRLLGFVLTGSAAAERAGWLKQLKT